MRLSLEKGGFWNCVVHFLRNLNFKTWKIDFRYDRKVTPRYTWHGELQLPEIPKRHTSTNINPRPGSQIRKAFKYPVSALLNIQKKSRQKSRCHVPLKISSFDADTSGWYVDEHGTLMHDMLEKYQVRTRSLIGWCIWLANQLKITCHLFTYGFCDFSLRLVWL